ncbi:sigma factor-like helix-turn-helix DNA-binding protein [Brevibacillus panacihumi]|nr:sigma factor-like helix-turn-helix DNA-binding protein [Brevibacillus panacihumi]
MVAVDSELFVEELLQSLPDKARFIIQKVVIEGIPEKEVAKQLNLSQQRVNAYKQKTLKMLKEKLIINTGRRNYESYSHPTKKVSIR